MPPLPEHMQGEFRYVEVPVSEARKTEKGQTFDVVCVLICIEEVSTGKIVSMSGFRCDVTPVDE